MTTLVRYPRDKTSLSQSQFMDPCAANTTWLVCRFRHFTGFIAGCRSMGRAGINNFPRPS